MPGKVAAVVLWGVMAMAAGASAQFPDTVLLEELTWTEVRDAEQNGPHMTLGKQNARVIHHAPLRR
ncbi:MAG: hypothetical protein ACREI6_03635 [Candidatus Rokuibacteriota bacterium]